MSNGIYVRVKYRDGICFEQKFRAISGDTIVLSVDDLVAEKVAAEREACAALCDKLSDEDGFEGSYADRCAFAIRERGAP